MTKIQRFINRPKIIPLMKGRDKILKRILVVTLIILSLFLILFEFKSIEAVSEFPLIRGAHRGSSVNFTENTIEAFENAISESKYNFIEFDVQYTKDKEIVVFHDYSLMRMNLPLTKIADLTLEEIREVEKYHIPTYEEVMDIIGNDTKIIIELKSQGDADADKEMVDEVIADSKERGLLKNILLISISADIVKYVTKEYSEMKTGIAHWVLPITYLPSEGLINSFYEEVAEIGADYILLHGTNIKNYDLLTRLKPKDKKLIFWYFSDEIYILNKDPQDGLW